MSLVGSFINLNFAEVIQSGQFPPGYSLGWEATSLAGMETTVLISLGIYTVIIMVVANSLQSKAYEIIPSQ